MIEMYCLKNIVPFLDVIRSQVDISLKINQY